jgi:hypothetical protein
MAKPDFSTYPKPIRERLLALRQMIYEVAAKTPGVGKVEEALRWGQPSYLTPETGSGSTIRIDGIKDEPGKYAMYFICTSGLIDDFKDLYKDEMKFVGNRSIVFDVGDMSETMPGFNDCIAKPRHDSIRFSSNTSPIGYPMKIKTSPLV